MINKTISHMCKSARAMGLPKAKWLQVEDHVSTILRSSGPEYLINYLKEIKDAKVAQMTGAEYKMSWHKVNAKGEPAGWQAILWKLKPKTSIQVLGAMINSIQLQEPTSKQLEKWKSGVRSPLREDRPKLSPSEQKVLRRQVRLDTQLISSMLWANIRNQRMFDLRDITGTSIPVLKSHASINRSKDESTYLRTLGSAYIGTLNSAPAFAGKLVMENLQDNEVQDIEEKSISYRLAKMIYHEGQHREYYPGPDDWADSALHLRDLVGQIAFLEQPGGKLRTIANPNRYVQYALRPLQRAIADTINSKRSVCVEEQIEGIRWAQGKLRDGVKLHSFDLSAATDILDIEGFNDLIEEAVAEKPFLVRSERYQVFRRNFDAFLHASDSNWYSPDLDKQVQWKVGQPLGLAPSFGVLTWMNYTAGHTAAVLSGLDPEDAFRVVGDDLICDERMAEAYARVIQSFNGLNNPDKEIVSDKYGEFCSQLITKDTYFPLKPKIRGLQETYFIDLEKGKPISKVPKGISSIGEYLALWSSSDIDNLPSVSGPSKLKSFEARLAASLHMRVSAHITRQEPHLREAALGPILNHAIQVSYGTCPFQNILNGDIPALGSPSVRTVVPSQAKMKYNWRRDEYERLTSDYTRARKLAKSIKAFERENPAHEGYYYVEFPDPYHPDRKIAVVYNWEEGAAIIENLDNILVWNDQVTALQSSGVLDQTSDSEVLGRRARRLARLRKSTLSEHATLHPLDGISNNALSNETAVSPSHNGHRDYDSEIVITSDSSSERDGVLVDQPSVECHLGTDMNYDTYLPSNDDILEFIHVLSETSIETSNDNLLLR